MRYYYSNSNNKNNQDGNKQYRTFSNEEIKARSIVVIDENGKNLGKMSRQDALELASSVGLDLVQISYDRDTMISTAKLLNLGKFLYEKKKKEKEKKKQQGKGMKELRLSYSTGDGDVDRKIKKISELLKEGYSIKVLLQVKGRERNFIDNAIKKIKQIQGVLEEYGKPQFKYPKQEKKGYYIIMTPLKKR